MDLNKDKLKEHFDMWKSTAESLSTTPGVEGVVAYNSAVTVAAVLNALIESINE